MKGHAGATFLRQVGEKARRCAQHSSLSVHVCCQGSCRPGARAWTDRINKGVWRVFVLIEESFWKVLWDNFEEILVSTNSKRMGGADMASLAKRVEVLEKRVGSR